MVFSLEAHLLGIQYWDRPLDFTSIWACPDPNRHGPNRHGRVGHECSMMGLVITYAHHETGDWI